MINGSGQRHGPPLLKISHLSMSFPGTKALNDVSLEVHSGEIVGLLGQNGSGKSTLVKVLAGLHEPDPGSRIEHAQSEDGQSEVHFIHQDLGLIGPLSTVENLDLTPPLAGRALKPTRSRAERVRAQELIAEFGGTFDVTVPVVELSAAERAIVAIARALSGWTHRTNVLVLDEPTAPLHGDEVELLFAAVRRVAQRGTGVVFISHRLDEVMNLVDRVAVLRDGACVADLQRGELDHDSLVRLIAGEMVEVSTSRNAVAADRPVLKVVGLSGPSVHGVDLEVSAGEILGVSGTVGSGRDELASIIFGAAPGHAKTIEVQGRPVTARTPRAAIRAGMALVPSDRLRSGSFHHMSARENMTLLRLKLFTRLLGWLDRSAEDQEAASWAERIALRPATVERPFGLYSGGNQQKIVLAKWLANKPQLLLLDEPTQGVDVGAKALIFHLIADAARSGAGVLVCSSDTRELTQTCHRIIVLRDGVVVAEARHPHLDEVMLVGAALGNPPHEETVT